MKVAVLLTMEPAAGGGFQYEVKIAALLSQAAAQWQVQLFCLNPALIAPYARHGLTLHLLPADDFERELVQSFQADLLYFLSPSALCLQLQQLPYVLTVWDLCHRDHPEFPEVRADGEFARREQFYAGPALSQAVAVIVDSDHSAAQLCRRYGLDRNRIRVLPFLPRLGTFDGGSVDIHQQFGLAADYVFYPAQFWAHKNHVYIVAALALLKEAHGVRLDAVFCGKDYGNLSHVLQLAQQLGITEQIHYLGFADDALIPSLYRQSRALVMPTYFGPTNIPPLEAFHYGVPVCYPDLPGLRDQVGDAAYLMDLSRPDSLVQQLLNILQDPAAVQQKIAKGKARLAGWTDADFAAGIGALLDDFAAKRRCWGATLWPQPVAPEPPPPDFAAKFYAVSRLVRSWPAGCRVALYGAGTVGDIVLALAGAQICVVVDQSSGRRQRQADDAAGTVYAPELLSALEFDLVLISVLGREAQISAYLSEKLGIAPEKIQTLSC